MSKIKVIKGSQLPVVEDINKSTFLAYEDKTISLKSGRIDLKAMTPLFGVSQEKGQSLILVPSLKLFTDENNLSLKKADLTGSSQDFVYAPDMSGSTTSAKASSILVNTDAVVSKKGTLTKISISSADSGNIKIHILSRSGNVFTSVASQNINVSVGISQYTIALNILENQYVGLEISPTNASLKYFQSGKTGYWGGLNGGTFSNVPTGLICYGFVVESEATVRPQEVEAFEASILATAQINAETYTDELITSDNSPLLKKADLETGGEIYHYKADLNGSVNSQKASSMLINALAKTSMIGTLTKVAINATDSGLIKVHVFSKAGNVFTSVASQELNVKSGINTYNTNVNVLSDEYYIGLEISATYASVKTYSSGQEGFYGGANGSVHTFIASASICYNFTIQKGENEPRPQEVEGFKSEILADSKGYTDNKIANIMITARAGHQLYKYSMIADNSDFTNYGFTYSAVGATPTIQGMAGRLFVKKQINIETKIQRCIATLQANTILVLYTEGKEESTLKTAVSVNMADKTINIYQIFSGSVLPAIRSSKVVKFSLVAGRKYIIEMYRLARANGVRIIDTLTGNSDYIEVYPTQAVHGSDTEVYVGGLQYDQFGIFWNGGTAPLIHELSCGYFGVRNPLLYIVGDSITYGYGTNDPALAYAHIIGALTGGDYIVSPRGGGKIGGVLEKIQTECSIIKPVYIMVTIGTNAAPSVAELEQLVTAIKAIGSIPIINCIPCRTNGEQMTANDRILALGEYTCRFDLATAIDKTAATLKADLSLYVDGGVHPNTTGFQRMADRVRIDLPFLF